MSTLGLFVRLEAKVGKEQEVESILHDGLALVQAEPGTISWYALRLGPTTFGIFDSFSDEGGRNAHLAGQLAATLMSRAEELFATPPVIDKINIIASKMPK
jgi:quinol monooxygenase YgiN